MTPLRQQMIDAMQLRGFSIRTHKCYLAAVYDLARYYHRSPDQLSIDEIQAYFMYLVKERGLCGATCRLYLNAIRFLYLQVLEWPSFDARRRQVCLHISQCRTPALGGLQLHCDHCEYAAPLYHACRDRHCPKCQQ